MSRDEYDPIKCPMPDCDADLFLDWTASIGLSRGLLTVADDSWMPDPAHPDGAGWRVACAEGHVVLLPGPTGCPCGADSCARHGFDEAEDLRRFHALDAERLSEVLTRLGAVTR
ncbi:hypothetical protein [Dactylosporangium sp. CA-139066]|uniref:hypothetical protein n=1 Tax=Dactylosporangium sp. CA-139066 TaxID=3239930 RepID=UPI003D91D92B